MSGVFTQSVARDDRPWACRLASLRLRSGHAWRPFDQAQDMLGGRNIRIREFSTAGQFAQAAQIFNDSSARSWIPALRRCSVHVFTGMTEGRDQRGDAEGAEGREVRGENLMTSSALSRPLERHVE